MDKERKKGDSRSKMYYIYMVHTNINTQIHTNAKCGLVPFMLPPPSIAELPLFFSHRQTHTYMHHNTLVA